MAGESDFEKNAKNGIVSEIPDSSTSSIGWERANSTVEAIQSGAKASGEGVELPTREILSRKANEADSLKAQQITKHLDSLEVGAEADYQESLEESATKRYANKVDFQKKHEKDVKLLTRFGLAAGALAIGAAALLGIKSGSKSEKPSFGPDRSTTNNEQVLSFDQEKDKESADAEVRAEEKEISDKAAAPDTSANAAAKANLEDGNNTDGLNPIDQ